MKTRLLAINEKSLSLACEIINGGGVVAFPTETVYGLGASAFDDGAVEKIFIAKGRPQDNPLIVHVANKEMISLAARQIPPLAQAIIDAFMPAPLTLILPKSGKISSRVTAGLDSVGVRMPLSGEARRFIEKCGVPIAAPSANTSSRPSPTTAKDVYEDLCGKIPLILKGDDSEVGIESTVLSLIDEPMILRPGVITAAEIEKVLGRKVAFADSPEKGAASPGVKYGHYMPLVPTKLLINPSDEDIVDEYAAHAVLRPVVLCALPRANRLEGISVYSFGSTLKEGAHNYFSALRYLEKKFGYIIQVYDFSKTDGAGLLNRMIKSANGNIWEET